MIVMYISKKNIIAAKCINVIHNFTERTWRKWKTPVAWCHCFLIFHKFHKTSSHVIISNLRLTQASKYPEVDVFSWLNSSICLLSIPDNICMTKLMINTQTKTQDRILQPPANVLSISDQYHCCPYFYGFPNNPNKQDLYMKILLLSKASAKLKQDA